MSIPKRQIGVGVGMILVGVLGFLVSLEWFERSSLRMGMPSFSVYREIIVFSFLLGAGFGVGYLFGGRRRGWAWVLYWGLLLLSASALGHFRSNLPLVIQKYLPFLFFCMVMILVRVVPKLIQQIKS